MKYFKVKKEADQTIKPSKKYEILIKDELYTEKELIKMKWNNDNIINSCFDIVEVSKKTTAFLFGARFSTALKRN